MRHRFLSLAAAAKTPRFGLTALIVAAMVATPLVAAPISEIVVFGDSFSDTGNVYAVVGLPASPPHDNGRFSNGPMWVERLAERLGVPAPVPSLAGGTNYAWGGATTGSVDNSIGVPNIDAQVAQYLGVLGDSTPAADALFVLLGGANDHLNGQTEPELAGQSLADQVSALAAEGAQQFLVGNVFTHADGPYVIEQVWAEGFKNALEDKVAGLRVSDSKLSITLVDFYSLVEQIKADPASVGLANGVDPACPDCNIGDNPNPDLTSIVPNPDDYFFWDYVHPTRAGHALLGDAAYEALGVPEPSSLLLLAGAFVLGAAIRRRR